MTHQYHNGQWHYYNDWRATFSVSETKPKSIFRVSSVSETGNRIVAGDDIPWGESVDLISRTNLNNLIATQDLKYSFLQGPRNAY